MSDRDPSKTPAFKEAAAWFARLNTPSVSAETLEAFRQWRRGPGHRQAYAEVEALWGRAAPLAADPEIQQALDAALAGGGRSRRGLSPAWPAGAAVGLSLAVVLAGVLVWPQLAGQRYSTGVGEARLVQLDDGSRVRLDTDTLLVVRYSQAQRDVRLLRGQAFFTVAHQPDRPFVVNAGAVTVRALGTRFDVRRDGSQAQVVLAQGRVEVRPTGATQGTPVILRPGQQTTAAGRLEPARAADLAAATDWTNGRIRFQAVPLRQAVAEVNRYSRRKLVLANPALGDIQVSGEFDSGDTEAFVAALAELHGVTARPDGHGGLRLTGGSRDPPG